MENHTGNHDEIAPTGNASVPATEASLSKESTNPGGSRSRKPRKRTALEKPLNQREIKILYYKYFAEQSPGNSVIPNLVDYFGSRSTQDDMIQIRSEVTNSSLSCWAFPGGFGKRVRFSRIGKNYNLEKLDGTQRPLRLQTDDAGVASNAHVVFFPDGIAAVEYNHEGPRPGKIREFLRHQFGGRFGMFYMDRLLGSALIHKFAQLREITFVNIRVAPSIHAYESAVAKASTLPRMLSDARDLAGSKEVSIQFYAGRKRTDHLSEELREDLRHILNEEALINSLIRLNVKGRPWTSDRVEDVDLVKEDMSDVTTIRDGTPEDVSRNTFEALEECYRIRRPMLKSASSLAVQ